MVHLDIPLEVKLKMAIHERRAEKKDVLIKGLGVRVYERVKRQAMRRGTTVARAMEEALSHSRGETLLKFHVKAEVKYENRFEGLVGEPDFAMSVDPKAMGERDRIIGVLYRRANSGEFLAVDWEGVGFVGFWGDFRRRVDVLATFNDGSVYWKILDIMQAEEGVLILMERYSWPHEINSRILREAAALASVMGGVAPGTAAATVREIRDETGLR